MIDFLSSAHCSALRGEYNNCIITSKLAISVHQKHYSLVWYVLKDLSNTYDSKTIIIDLIDKINKLMISQDGAMLHYRK